MSIYALTGNDNLLINSRPIINDLADGSVIEIAYDNDRIGTATGKNGNTIIADNQEGKNATLTLRVIRSSATDKYLNGLSIQQEKDLVTFSLMQGAFTKRIGDGSGKVTFDNYTLQGGAFRRFPDAQENNQGETEQGVTIYTIFFAKATRGVI